MLKGDFMHVRAVIVGSVARSLATRRETISLFLSPRLTATSR